jgi:hypothetical protein
MGVFQRLEQLVSGSEAAIVLECGDRGLTESIERKSFEIRPG